MKGIRKRIITVLLSVIMLMTMIPTHAFAATNVTSNYGWGYTWVNKTLYDNSSMTIINAGIYVPANTGFTIVDTTSNAYQINYKEGTYWIEKGYMTTNTLSATAAVITSTKTVYSNANTSYTVSYGTLHVNDIVSVLYKNGSWYLIEFNDSTFTRKRGWITNSNVTLYESSSILPTFSELGGNSILTNGEVVYYAPGTGYTGFDVIYSSYNILQYLTIHGQDYAYIRYSENGYFKTAYIKL